MVHYPEKLRATLRWMDHESDGSGDPPASPTPDSPSSLSSSSIKLTVRSAPPSSPLGDRASQSLAASRSSMVVRPSPGSPPEEPEGPPLKTYFVYVNDETGDLYFYEPDTSETTYERPEEGLLLDPDTGLPYLFPNEDRKRRHTTSRKHSAASSVDVTAETPGDRRSRHHGRRLLIEVTPEVREARSLERRGLAPPRLVIARPTSFVPDPNALALPGDLSEEISRFKVAEYASEFFRTQRCTRVFSRKQVRLSADQIFQLEPIKAPLLISTTKAVAKQAIETFKLILSYTAAGSTPLQPKAALMTLRRLLKLGVDFCDLRDEIYFQLVKQTRRNGEPDCALRSWELFLIVATVLPSTRNSESDIKSHLVHHARAKVVNIATIAQFTYIRYSSRCLTGKPMDDAANISPELVARITRDPFEGRVAFGVSITEQLWHQRARAPNCPIPLILRDFAETLLEKGARTSVGIFRMSGSARAVAELTVALNEATDCKAVLARAALNDIAQLIKQWFTMLPGKIVPADIAGGLRSIFETNKDYLPFINRLPGPEHAALKFLIGLLQELVKSEPDTKMGPKNYAIVIGPAIVASTAHSDQKAALAQNEIMQDFVVNLIAQWDTSDVWPFPESWLSTEAP